MPGMAVSLLPCSLSATSICCSFARSLRSRTPSSATSSLASCRRTRSGAAVARRPRSRRAASSADSLRGAPPGRRLRNRWCSRFTVRVRSAARSSRRSVSSRSTAGWSSASTGWSGSSPSTGALPGASAATTGPSSRRTRCATGAASPGPAAATSSRARRGRTRTSSPSAAGCATSCSPWSSFDTLLQAQVLIEDWRIEYNTRRPHSSLGWLTPAAYAGRLTEDQPAGLS